MGNRLGFRLPVGPALGNVRAMTAVIRLFLFVAACFVGVAPLRALPPTVALKTPAKLETGARLEWTASSPELEFTVEARSGLGSGEWTPLPGQTWPIPAKEFLDAAAAEARFYRVVGTPIVGERGRLISTTLVTNLSQFQIQLIFGFGGIPITPQSGVKVYKVIYETVDAQGLRTQASGSLCLPDNRPAGGLPLVSYQHGTVTEREDVPSRLNFEGFIGVAMATSGYAAVLPDYLGLGDSPGIHPYHHAKSEATCVVDLLRATRSYCASNTVALSGKLFLTGYSHGGHATLAAMREIEELHATEFPITACAPGAGAYDLAGVTAEDFLADKAKPNPYYLPYLLVGLQDVYGWVDRWSDVLVAPYATTIPPLFNGQHGSGEINDKLPAKPSQILRPETLESFRNNPADPLRTLLRENDLIRWTPKAPLRLYHCSGDQDVPPANMATALAAFHARGATHVQALDPLPGADHGGCVQPALLAAKAWFDTLR